MRRKFRDEKIVAWGWAYNVRHEVKERKGYGSFD